MFQKEKLNETSGDLVNTDGFTFAPRPDGGTVSKPQMVNAIQKTKTAHVAGLRLKDDEGRDTHTGHIFRIGGTRHMIKNGVSVPPIMVLARWDWS